MRASGRNRGKTDIQDRMTVINKVNDDSDIYFRDESGKGFIIQCGKNHFIVNHCYL